MFIFGWLGAILGEKKILAAAFNVISFCEAGQKVLM